MKFALETGRCTYAGIDDFANPDAVTLIRIARTSPPYRRCIAAHGCSWLRLAAVPRLKAGVRRGVGRGLQVKARAREVHDKMDTAAIWSVGPRSG